MMFFSKQINSYSLHVIVFCVIMSSSPCLMHGNPSLFVETCQSHGISAEYLRSLDGLIQIMHGKAQKLLPNEAAQLRTALLEVSGKIAVLKSVDTSTSKSLEIVAGKLIDSLQEKSETLQNLLIARGSISRFIQRHPYVTGAALVATVGLGVMALRKYYPEEFGRFVSKTKSTFTYVREAAREWFEGRRRPQSKWDVFVDKCIDVCPPCVLKFFAKKFVKE